MYITSHQLYRDTGNFFRNKFTQIISISLLTSVITIIINNLISPNIDQIHLLNQNKNHFISVFNFMNDISNDQKLLLLRILASNIVSILIGNTILLLGILCLIYIASSVSNLNIFQVIKLIFIMFPKMFTQTFIITILIQFGFLLLIIPGILLSILLSLSPLILFKEQINIINSIKKSMKLAWKNITYITPIIIFWTFSRLFLILLFSKINIFPNIITILLLNTLSNILSSLLVIYLYRLYMLVK